MFAPGLSWTSRYAAIVVLSASATLCSASTLRRFDGKVVLCGAEAAEREPARSLTRSKTSWDGDVFIIDARDMTGEGRVSADSGGHLVVGHTVYVWYSLDFPKHEGPPLACEFPVRLRYEIEGLPRDQYRVKLVRPNEVEFMKVFAAAILVGGLLASLPAVVTSERATWRKAARVSRTIGLVLLIPTLVFGTLIVAALLR